MRAVVVALTLLPLHAWAQATSSLAIEPFHARCFDADRLAERLRAELPSAPVRVGLSSAARHVVHVREEGDRLVVEITQRGAGAEQRVVPAGVDCDAALQATTLIVVRAVLPLFTPPVPHPGATPAHPPQQPRPPPAPPRTPPPRPAPAPVPAPSPPLTVPPGAPVPSPAPPSTATPSPPTPSPPTPQTPPRASASEPPPRPAPAPPPPRPTPAPGAAPAGPAVVQRALPPRRRQVELDVRAGWTFPLDGPPSAPVGELAIGHTWKRGAGLSLRAGVEGENTASTQTSAGATVSLSTRRLPLGLEAHYDLRIPTGSIRLGAGPMVALWLVRSAGIPHPTSSTLAEPGATVRIAYRLDLRHFCVSAGVVLDALFTAHDLEVGGVGTIARTSLVEVTPYLSLGGQIF